MSLWRPVDSLPQPNRHKALNQYWFTVYDVGPTLIQRLVSAGKLYGSFPWHSNAILTRFHDFVNLSSEFFTHFSDSLTWELASSIVLQWSRIILYETNMTSAIEFDMDIYEL